MRKKLNILYAVYFAILFSLVTCKIQKITYYIKDDTIIHLVMQSILLNRKCGYWNYNLKPFESYYSWYIHGIYGSLIRNLLGNIVAFVPMGFFEMGLSKHRKFWKVVLECFIIVTCLELFQFFACLGYLDIDDITMNTFGCVLGCLGFNLLALIYRKKIRR